MLATWLIRQDFLDFTQKFRSGDSFPACADYLDHPCIYAIRQFSERHEWTRDIELLQMRLEANEQITPHEVCQAAVTLLGLQMVWNITTPDELKVLCQILFQDIVFDFVTNAIVSIPPKSEYVV